MAICTRGTYTIHGVVYIYTYRVYDEINHCVRHGSKAVQKTGSIRFNSDGFSIGPMRRLEGVTKGGQV